MKNLLRINKLVVGHLFVLFVVALFFISSADYSNNLMVISWINNFIFIWSIYTIYKLKKDIFDFNIIFLLFIFLFCNGQVLLYSLGVDKNQLSVFVLSSPNKILIAAKYFCMGFLFFHLGSLLVLKQDKNDNNYFQLTNNYNLAIRYTAFLIMFLSIVPFFYTIIPKVYKSIIYGYNYLYENPNVNSGIIVYLGQMFIPSLFMILYTYRNRKISFAIIIIALLVCSILYIIIGSRGSALSIIVALIVFYNTFVKKIKGRKLLLILLIVFGFMIIIPTIYNYREVDNKSIESLSEIIDDTIHDSDNNFMVKTISELGYTMHSFILTKNAVPSIHGYGYGKSYLASFLMLIPSPLLGGYTFANDAALDTWLQKTYNMSYGPGFSPLAESYYNFGFYFGVAFMSILGLFYTKMFNLKNTNKDKNSLLALISFIFLYNSLLATRYPFHGAIRNVFYMGIVIYYIVIYIKNDIGRRNKVNNDSEVA